ncbi:uncharacterized protein [Anabrus simplex]|uniref:uncharacterized protein n=1 Tax=Anabrus simplex TaxID=316456 RepID=UPI0035A286EB
MDQDTSIFNICASPSSSDAAYDANQLNGFTDLPLNDTFDNLGENVLSNREENTLDLPTDASESVSHSLEDMGIENTWADENSLATPPAADFPIPLPPPGGFDDLTCLDPVTTSNENGSFSESDLGTLFNTESHTQEDVKDASASPGVCGLRNLGNTCFMGAGLQCLVATPPLVHFFLGRYPREKGLVHSLTDQFCALLHKVWSGQYSIIQPTEFKEALGYNHPQFKDYRQHDCQEFLALLLDNLHEELNASSCKSILSDGSTDPATPHSTGDILDEKEMPQKLLLDHDLTSQTTSLDSLRCSHSSSSHSSESSVESRSVFRLKTIPEDITSFRDIPCFEKQKEKELESTTVEDSGDSHFICNQTSDSVSNNSVFPNYFKKDFQSVSTDSSMEKNIVASRLNNVTKRFCGLQDILKDAKTSNVNVLVTEPEANNEIRFDSDKFPKHDNVRRRDPLENPNLTEFHNFDNKTVSVKRIKETNLHFESPETSPDCKCFNNIKRMKLEEQEKNYRMECERKLRDFDVEEDSMDSDQAGGSGTVSHIPDELEADKHWEKHINLNQSIIVDSFQGQFKSTVVCSSCKHVSVTYEPFMYLSVPLPHAMERQICVTFVPATSSSSTKYLVTLNKQDRVKSLKEQVLLRLGENGPKNIALAEVLDSHIARVLDDNSLLRYVNDINRSIYAFELLPSPVTSSLELESSICKRVSSTEQEGDNQRSGAASPLDLTPSLCLNGGGDLSSHNRRPVQNFIGPLMEDDCEPVSTATISSPAEQGDGWKSCAICLEEMDSDLRRHVSCSCILCESCIETSCRHYGGDKLNCPVCGVTVSPETEFIPLDKVGDFKPTVRLLNVPVVFRLDTEGDGNNNRKTMKLFGHPKLVRLPNRLSGQDLYEAVDQLIPYKVPYSILFVDGQGYHCSRCIYTMHCRGCQVSPKGEVILQTGDTLAVRLTEMVSDTSSTVEHPSMRDLRCRDPLSLYDCIQAFSESEQLDEHNPWYCPVCQKNQCATKTLSVWRYPDFLIVYLKRFIFHECVSLKLENKVTFPISGLSVTPASILQHGTSLPYNLYACVCHFGGSSAGHYTAYSKNPRTNEWHYYNDEAVIKQRPQEEDYSNAYILFYQKQGVPFELSVPNLLMGDRNSKPNIEQLILDLDSSVEQDWQ